MKGCRKQRIERVRPDRRSLISVKNPLIGLKAWPFIPKLGQRPDHRGHMENQTLYSCWELLKIFMRENGRVGSFEITFLTALVG